MGLEYTVKLYNDVVKKDIPTLDSSVRKTVKNAINAKLTTSPQLYGKPLRQSLKGWRKLRVRDYRVVFRIRGKIVEIAAVQHRSVVYANVIKRFG